MRFAVVGDPVAHSRSPAIHNAAFAAAHVEAEFEFVHLPADQFEQVVDALKSGLLDGVSVTMPHKRSAFAGVDERSDDAVRTGAVNTIVVDEDRLVGHNTDVAGVRYALATVESDATAPVLILGTGGAAAAALLAVEGRRVFVSGRVAEKSHALAHRVGVEATVLPWGSPVPMATVINATPLGMAGELLPDGVVERAGALVDMTYGIERSPAVAHALALGLPTADGLTMLVGQAIEAFELFTGLPAPAMTMEQAARSVPDAFVPGEFTVPIGFEGVGFHLEPLGPQHNDRDYEAWTSSIGHIIATPGFDARRWPTPMSLDENLADLVGHANDFTGREGFTYSILDRDAVIGCLYIYPSRTPGNDALVRSWVRESRAEMDSVVWRSISRWLADDWPFENPLYEARTE